MMREKNQSLDQKEREIRKRESKREEGGESRNKVEKRQDEIVLMKTTTWHLFQEGTIVHLLKHLHVYSY